MKKGNKQGKILDRGTTAVLILFGAGLIALAIFMAASILPKDKENTTAGKATADTAGPSETPASADEADLVRYTCVISEKQKDADGSEFCMEFNTKDNTYKKYLNAGTSSSELDRGTYIRKKNSIELTDKKGNKNSMLCDGNTLVSKNALFKGKVPGSKTFSATLSHSADKTSSINIIFKKDGTFRQVVLRPSSKEGEVQKNETAGSYVRRGNFIERKREDKTSLMPLYVYRGQICASYYILEENSRRRAL